VADQYVIGLGVFNGIPDPQALPGTALELDWMLWKLYQPTASGAVIDEVRTVEIDLKAKRRLADMGRIYGLYVFNGTAAINTVRVGSSTLVALH
jgi:hypothetical protein